MNSKHLIDLEYYPVSVWSELLDTALRIRENPWMYKSALSGKILATLFYEPSTRTQMSFQSAMLRLGGSVIGFDNPMNSSVAKGENLKDTITIIGSYSDLIVIRNPMEGCARAAALYADRPIINAGDGGHLHPTQTLTDLTALRVYKGGLDGLTVGLCGDLKNGRTVHSLIKAMCHFRTKFVLISTPELGIPQYLKDVMDASGCTYQEIYSLEDAIGCLDVLYMTRIQRERFASEAEYERQRGAYILDKAKISLARHDLMVLHPLPRVDEIALEVDDDPRAKYFEQAQCGVYARMALMCYLLEDGRGAELPAGRSYPGARCQNPRCITRTEPYLPHTFTKHGDMLICDYCESRMLI